MWRPAVLQKAEAALLDEKAAKLRGLAQLLDDRLGDSFDVHLDGAVAPEERLVRLSSALRPIADQIAAAFPRVGLGYYDAVCDRIVAYAPSAELGYLVGISPPPDHLGRVAMERRDARIAIGSMVRGDALNCMRPIVRGDRVIGFTFANETVEDIYRQLASGTGRQGQSAELPTAMGLASLAVFAGTSELAASAIRGQLAQSVAQGQLEQQGVLPLMTALQQVERHVRLFLDNLGLPLALVDQHGQISFANRELTELCGATASGQAWSDLTAALNLKLTSDPATGAGEQQVLPATANVEGRNVAFDLLTAALPGLPGQRLYLFAEVDRAHREGDHFERAERLALAGELATAIAHEIRNPLTVVAGSIQLIPDRVDDREFLLSLSRIAGGELARVNRIIQRLLGFARYAEPERALIDLNGLISETVEFLDWYARKGGVTVTTALNPGGLLVYGDREHLKQALLNLIMNGIQAMEGRSGSLQINTDQPTGKRMARITIRDAGVGIPAEQLPHIWKVFYSSKQGGTGLGLPVAHRIIDAHQGYIEVESTPGEGTSFNLFLPVAGRPSLIKREEADANAPITRSR